MSNKDDSLQGGPGADRYKWSEIFVPINDRKETGLAGVKYPGRSIYRNVGKYIIRGSHGIDISTE